MDINRHKSARLWEQVKGQQDTFEQLWDTFVAAAKVVRRNGGKVCIEWPKSCVYWDHVPVIQFMQEFGIKKAEVHGCSLGLKDDKDDPTPINKPWFIATDDQGLFDTLNKCRCPGCKTHAKCEGRKLCQKSEGYTDEMARLIHSTWKRSASLIRVGDNRKQGGTPYPIASAKAFEQIPAMPTRDRK